jgi:hydrogenase nickel incorporation protein HypA/HybF
LHELSIASSILETVRGELAGRPGVRPTAIALRIGALSGVDAESLRFGFEALVRDTEYDPLRLDIELVPRRHKCMDCGAEYDVADNDSMCITCGSLIAVCIAGEELDIAWVEVEER